MVFGIPESLAQTTVEKIGGQWHLLIDGKPFDIKGATFGYNDDVENYDSYFKDLRSIGVNTIRTWGTDKNTTALLDSAHKYGIKVMLGIWMRHGRPGMEADDSFNYLEDTEGMEAMYYGALNTVETYKDHPAVLTWGVANEVYLNMATDEEKLAYSKLLERICSNIKKQDPNHPITSVEAWTFGLDWWPKYVPSIDIYGLNAYGPGAGLLQAELDKRNIDKPYVITEFGVTGEWDIQATKHGIKLEPSDQEKYEAITTGYRDWIQNKPSCLGVYVFNYADGHDFLSAWLFTHHNGKKRPQYWAIREAYTDQKPINNTPVINSFTLPDSTAKSGDWVPVSLEITDPETDDLDISFHYNQRIGTRIRKSQVNGMEHRGELTKGFEVLIPKEDGAIKVYVNATDSYGNVGIASSAIAIDNGETPVKAYLTAKTTLPFYVYKDGKDLPYVPSAYMGNIDAIGVELEHKSDVHAGTAALKISYNAKDNWYGLGFVDPPNDWGDMLGGYDISGAKKFTFWAKTDSKLQPVTIGFGLIGTDKPYPDSAKKQIEIKLTNKWKQYSINLKKLDLGAIRSGLVLFSQSYNAAHYVLMDEVRFE
ncbi:MAG: hypothetical protein HKN96_05360 [Flavobacteriaceae bacterium]|nr:hypothetical protein [Flavobacteriaceae bacterium]